MGSINVEFGTGQDSSAGYADLLIPISGPYASGTIVLQATKAGEDWDYSRLEVVIGEDGERIDLLEGP